MDNHAPTPRPGNINPGSMCSRPGTAEQPTPEFIVRFLDRIGDSDLTAHAAFYFFTGRQRTIRKAGRQSLNAVLRVLLANVDMATATVTSNYTNLARQCGLITRSPAGITSITRFSRALKELEKIGAIYRCKGGSTPESLIFPLPYKDIVITPLGFGIYGISKAEWEAAVSAMSGGALT